MWGEKSCMLKLMDLIYLLHFKYQSTWHTWSNEHKRPRTLEAIFLSSLLLCYISTYRCCIGMQKNSVLSYKWSFIYHFPVHELKPGDIKVVAAVGDSLTVSIDTVLYINLWTSTRLRLFHHVTETLSSSICQAGNGIAAKPNNILDVLQQYRGLSWRYVKTFQSNFTFGMLLIWMWHSTGIMWYIILSFTWILISSLLFYFFTVLVEMKTSQPSQQCPVSPLFLYVKVHLCSSMCFAKVYREFFI